MVDFTKSGLAQKESLLSFLLKEQRFSVIAGNLDKFSKGTVDLPNLIDRLLKADQANVIANNLDKLLAAGAEPSDLIDRLLKAGETSVIANNLDKFPKDSVDAADLIDRLLNAGETSVIANNLYKFPPGTVNLPDLIDRLLKTGETYIIADNLDKFLAAVADPSDLIDRLLKAGHAYVIANNLDKFPPGTVDLAGLIERLLKAGQAYDIADNLDKFPPGTVDLPDLIDRLLKAGHASVIANNLDKFPPGTVNLPDLIDRLLKAGPSSVIANNLDKFLAAGADPSDLIDRLLNAGETSVIADNLDKFPKGSVDLPVLVGHLITERSGLAFLKYFENLLDYGLDPQGLALAHKEALRNALSLHLSEVIAQERYQLLSFWVKETRHSGIAIPPILSEQSLATSYRSLVRDERVKTATALRDAAEGFGVILPEEHLPGALDAREPDQEVAAFISDKERQKQILPHEEVAQFYIDDVCLSSLQTVSTSPDAFSLMEFRDRVTYERLNDQIEHRTQQMYTWMKWYLLRALSSELSHQQSDALNAATPSDPDRFAATASREQILDFFATAAGRFKNNDWGKGYGGTQWARIAETAYAVFATKRPSRVLIDRVFDLEHNTGAIFDKAPERIKLDKTILKSTLEAKARASLPEDLLKTLEDQHLVSETLFISLGDRLRAVNALKRKFTKR